MLARVGLGAMTTFALSGASGVAVASLRHTQVAFLRSICCVCSANTLAVFGENIGMIAGVWSVIFASDVRGCGI